MTVEEITNQAYAIAKEPIDLLTSRRFINDAMQSLAATYDTACKTSSVDITCTDEKQEYDLPSDCIGVTKVKRDGYKVNCYTVDGNSITFNFQDTYTVSYLQIPLLAERKMYQKELKTDIPGINLLYHSALPYYVAGQTLFVNEPNGVKASAFISKYNTLVEEANKKLVKQKRKGARIAAPLFR